jgi:hypothetical protein
VIRAQLAAAAALSLALQGCLWRSTQRWPGPMETTSDPLPPGDSAQRLPGPEEVSIVRHADPVQVRPVGALSGHPLAFFDKRARLAAGSAVLVSPGGRAEVLWRSGASIVLFGDAVGWIGSPSRGEPMFEFQQVDRAHLNLVEGDQVRLLGGAVLTGASGPYVLERSADQTLLVHNQSKSEVRVAFREETFELGPGRGVRLPLLSSSGAPFAEDPDLERFAGPGFFVHLAGDPACAEERGGVVVRGDGDGSVVRALGVRVKLAADQSALISDPRPRRPETPPAPQPESTPADASRP